MRRSRDDGLSLVELLVALLVLSIAVIGLFRVMNQATLAGAADRDRSLARIVAQNRAAELALGLDDLPAQEMLAGRAWEVSVTQAATGGGFSETTVAVRPAGGGSGAQLLTYLPGGS